MPKTEEYKDPKGKNRIRHTADNGHVTYSSTQGYHNLGDMIDTAVNASIEILENYISKGKIKQDQAARIINLGLKVHIPQPIQNSEK